METEKEQKKNDEKNDNIKEIRESIDKIKHSKEHKEDKHADKNNCNCNHNDKTDKKDKTIEEKDKKIAELTDTLQRLQAEFENFKKRSDRENADYRQYCNAEMACKILPIIDSFEMALKHTERKEEFVKGVELIYSQLYDMLAKEGVRKIEAAGKKFDPYKHEVLLSEKTDKEADDEKVVEELQKGYMYKDKVLRFCKVKVLKKD